MLKKNDILSSDFLDFDLFASWEQQSVQKPSNPSNQFSTLAVYESDAENGALETFLSSILTAAKLDMSKDVRLFKTTPDARFSFMQMRKNTAIEKVIIFGIAPKNLGINLDLKLYVPMVIQGCTFLLANGLSDIQADTNKKRSLWNSLQEIYLK